MLCREFFPQVRQTDGPECPPDLPVALRQTSRAASHHRLLRKRFEYLLSRDRIRGNWRQHREVLEWSDSAEPMGLRFFARVSACGLTTEHLFGITEIVLGNFLCNRPSFFAPDW